MRVLAFSDLHRNKAAARKIVTLSGPADVIIGAGDFATAQVGTLETLDILRNCTAPVVLVHGNHDDPDEIARYCAGWADGHYLHATSVMIGGCVFFGSGGEIPARTKHPWSVSETEADAAELIKACPKDAILVTHTPPRGFADLQKKGAHKGSGAIREPFSTTSSVCCCAGISTTHGG